MAYPFLYINFIGAKQLRNVRHLGRKMRVYAVVSISGSRNNQQYTTDVDTEGGQNPNWSCNMKFTATNANSLTLFFKLHCERTLGDREVTEFSVPLTDLLSGRDVEQFVKYQVSSPSGEQLNFSYKFANTDEPQSGHSYPPQQGLGRPPVQAQASGIAGDIGIQFATGVAAGLFTNQLQSMIDGDDEEEEEEE